MTGWKDEPIAFVDTETTGLGTSARIVEMSVLVFEHRRFASQFTAVINPGNDVDWDHPDVIQAMKVNGLDKRLLEMSQGFDQLWPVFLTQLNRAKVLCGQYLKFDVRMIEQECRRMGSEFHGSWLMIDTKILDWGLHPGKESYSLGPIADRWNVENLGQRQAMLDVDLCARVLVAMMDSLPDDLLLLLQRSGRWNADYEIARAQREFEKKAKSL